MQRSLLSSGMIQSPGTPGQFFQCAGICPGLFTDFD